MLRTHTCGDLDLTQIDQKTQLCGWVDRIRDIGHLFFITLRDRYGFTQCVWESSENDKLRAALKSLQLEDCIQLNGQVRRRQEKDIRSDYSTGAIEVVIENLTILNPCASLPFQVKDQAEVNDELRFKYRYLDLRRPKMQQNMLTRHKVIQATRSALAELGFLELETPLLIRSTPEGSRDFVVPSRVHQGKFYALPQSPQLYKQMLMISGCDRYFQFAPAFRDEDLRADRVPVHSQIDMEMTFVDEADVFQAVEYYMARIFRDVRDVVLPQPFPIMTYAEAMERYGSDKPDTRFKLELKTISELVTHCGFAVFEQAKCVRMLRIPNGAGLSRKDIDQFEKTAREFGAKGLAWSKVKQGTFAGGIGKFLNFGTLAPQLEADEGDLLLFVADTYETCCKALSQVRLAAGKRLDLIGTGYNFLWINEFPLFEWDENRQAYNAMHHLFTQPKDEDMALLDTDPGKVRGKLYDLVLNGVELSSGSIRINRPEIQQKVLDIVGMPAAEAESKFGFLLEAFKYGAPPHGGSAVGLDRLVALLCGSTSIRDVIPYPCNNSGIFPLDGSPAPLDDNQLEELGLSVKKTTT